MKKLILIFLTFTLSTSFAQLDKGTKLAGGQLNLVVNDMYYTAFRFGNSGYEKYFGISIVPTYGYAIQRNWILGMQATFGIENLKFNGGGGAYTFNQQFTDIGLAPFTRLYLGITNNQKLKVFGVAALEFNIAMQKISYPDGFAPTSHSSNTTLTPSVGAGIAYFGRKTSFDLSMTTTAVRVGFYKFLPYRKK